MDSRFRVRFWTSRRAKRNSELDSHSLPYQNASEGKRKPVFIYQPLGRNLTEKRKSEVLALQGVSYGANRAGTPPTVGDLPHKGNGPIKLQTSRRLSSGELVTTSGDPDMVLDGMRDGEIYVPSRRDSRSMPRRNSSGDRRPSQSSLSSSPSQRRPPGSAPSGWAPFSGSTPLLDIPENSISQVASRQSTRASSGWSLSDPFRRSQSHQSPAPVDGLGISTDAPTGILKSSPPTHCMEPPPEQNATIRALWKAEYSRLVSLYGQSGVDKNFGDVPWEQKKLSVIEDREEAPAPLPLDPLPRPSFERHESLRKSRRLSRPEGHHDDTSDESSYRPVSFISSAGGYASSFTTRTSMAESDSINTKDDIRKMVESMRSTYLQALDAREPSLEAVKSMKKKKKRKSTTPSSTPRISSIPTTPETERAAAMTGNGSSPTLRSQRSTRTISQPVAGIPSLPAIEASPSRGEEVESGLKRADSATLGALMGETKRSSIKKRASSRQHSRRSSINNPKLRSSNSISKKPSPAEKENITTVEVNVVDEDFASLYKDIFNSTDFWQSPSTLDLIPSAAPSGQVHQAL